VAPLTGCGYKRPMAVVLGIAVLLLAAVAAATALASHIHLRRRTGKIDEVSAVSWMCLRMDESEAPIVFLHLSDEEPFFAAVIPGPGPMLAAAMNGMEAAGWDPDDHDQVEPERLYKEPGAA
jgi:hypothetical protein